MLRSASSLGRTTPGLPENGRIKEQGDHESLIAADGLYAHLWRMQQRKAEAIE